MSKRNPTIHEYLADLGRKGGMAGRGEAKRRGDSAYYRAIRAKGGGIMTVRAEEIQRNFEALWEMIPVGPYLVVRTAFHGGGLVSKHRTVARAAEAVAHCESQDCTCGCARIVPAAEWDMLPYASESRDPYAAARN